MNYAQSELAQVDNAPRRGVASQCWWESGWFWFAIAIASTIPLWWPTIPPLVDLPGHLGRYRIELELGSSESLQRYFSFHWALIGNLGVDLLIIPLAPIFGLEGAVKLIVMTIPALTVAGIYLVSKEVHGRVPPTSLFAVPFVYNFPFNFGFVNFALSMALALIALGGWIRYSSGGHRWLRAAVFAVAACIIWFVHIYGWALLLLCAWSLELVRNRRAGLDFKKAAVRAAFECIPLCIPFLFLIAWRTGAGDAGTSGFFGFNLKAYSFAAALRDRWMFWDTLCVALSVVLIAASAFHQRLDFSPLLAVPAAVLSIVFLLMPTYMFGSAFADTRLAPFILILAVAAVKLRDLDNARGMRAVTMMGLALIVLRLAGTTLSFAMADSEIRTESAALDHIPDGARVLSLVGTTCGTEWEVPRYQHLGSLVIERKHGFSNDQWRLATTQLLEIRHPLAGEFATDPSQAAFSLKCLKRFVEVQKDYRKTMLRKGQLPKKPAHPWRTADLAVANFPRPAFDYVWVLKAPDFDMTARPGLVPVWKGADSVLYRIDQSIRTGGKQLGGS